MFRGSALDGFFPIKIRLAKLAGLLKYRANFSMGSDEWSENSAHTA
jgi:hypothetical protein